MKMRLNYVAALLIAIAFVSFPQQKKFLFDAAHAETAANADWIIDGDGGVPGRYPTPAQSGITSSTPETYWTGALSSWGIALVKLGYSVETLPIGSSITYGTTNAQDLKNYDVFVIDEPNTKFTTAEKTALINFVQNGGGLFMISDHTGSDRNNDGWDSPMIWNDLFTANGIVTNPFGMAVDLTNISQTSTNVAAGDYLITGSAGTVTAMKWSNGATTTLNPTANSSVTGVVWTSGTAHGNTNLMVSRAKYGTGRVVLVCDSSPADDGTGTAGDQLYVGWLDPSVNGSHAALHLNGSLWLAKDSELPVELTSFTSTVQGNDIILKWNTATEVNSFSFDIETKKANDETWGKISSVQASGNSSSPRQYSYTDKMTQPGKYQFRLKMVDIDGSFKYSTIIETETGSPKSFSLSQNYPNPFNPSTHIRYSIPNESIVKLAIFNLTGEKIDELKNDIELPGTYELNWSASTHPSGIYFLSITGSPVNGSPAYSRIIKMNLVK